MLDGYLFFIGWRLVFVGGIKFECVGKVCCIFLLICDVDLFSFKFVFVFFGKEGVFVLWELFKFRVCFVLFMRVNVI